LKVGATHVLDPNAEGTGLVDRVRAISLENTAGNRYWAGGRDTGGRRSGSGADLVIEAAGADTVPPRMEAGPDPTGIAAVQQAYQMCMTGGHLVTTSLVRGNITLPGVLFNIGGITHHGGQYGGANAMRDIPRFVAMLEKGQYDARSLATRVVPLEQMREAYEEVVYRTTITAIMTL
jgi:S-(hydroxymethyl)glutathione dehydrogenase / alcohol dehydrogenase